MPIAISKRPGRKPIVKNGDAAEPVKAPAPQAPEESGVRVRMMRDITSRLGTFVRGKTYRLPTDTARSWIGFGFAEEDKALDHAPETK
jgi:hypothetical protein